MLMHYVKGYKLYDRPIRPKDSASSLFLCSPAKEERIGGHHSRQVLNQIPFKLLVLGIVA